MPTVQIKHFNFGQSRLERNWHTLQQGGGHLAVTEQGLVLATAAARRDRYSNAQIDDYGRLARRLLPWRPPVTLTLRARFGGPIRGTAGFGFWNNPLAAASPHVALPSAIWFLWTSPPSNIQPTLAVPGYGWKAACLDLTTPQALAWAPVAPAVLLANQVAPIRRRLWPHVERALRVAERDLGPPDTAWHTYTIEWRRNHARFLVDGAVVLETEQAPVGPLGFVAWVDTQYLVATPLGQFWWGLLDVPEAQWLAIDSLRIEGPEYKERS